MRLAVLAPLLLASCAAWFGTVGAHASPGDGYREVVRWEGTPNEGYESGSGDIVWVWKESGRVYKRAWLKWEPFHDGIAGRGLYLVRMEYNYQRFMENP